MTGARLILLAEDNLDHALLTMEALESAHGDATVVHHVRDGRELIDYLDVALGTEGAGTTLPQLIVLDLQMPNLDGFGVIERLKTDERLQRIPLVVLTSSDDPRDIQRSYDLGSNGYVQKPVQPGALHECVSQIPAYWLDLNATPPERTSS